MDPNTYYVGATYTKKPPKRVFFAASTVMFFLLLSVADSVGFVPYYIDGTPSNKNLALQNLPELGEEQTPAQPVQEEPTTVGPIASPSRIVISSIDLDLPVQNPGTRDVAALDELLKAGPARYVDSAKLGEKGNVLIFAHSSHLPVVHNQMYKAFNRVPELSSGNVITVIGKDSTGVEKSYLYVVQTVRRADAEDEVIDLSPKNGTRLTLVTCDTLTSKSTRWILEAEYVGVL